MIYTLDGLIVNAKLGSQVKVNDKWVPARPSVWKHRSLMQRIKEAWFVFTGKGDVFTWPEDEK